MKGKFLIFVTIFLLAGCSFNQEKFYTYSDENIKDLCINDGFCNDEINITDNDDTTYAELELNSSIATIYINAKSKNLKVKLEADNNISYAIRATYRTEKSAPIDYELENNSGKIINNSYTSEETLNGFYINISSKENTNIKVYTFETF